MSSLPFSSPGMAGIDLANLASQIANQIKQSAVSGQNLGPPLPSMSYPAINTTLNNLSPNLTGLPLQSQLQGLQGMQGMQGMGGMGGMGIGGMPQGQVLGQASPSPVQVQVQVSPLQTQRPVARDTSRDTGNDSDEPEGKKRKKGTKEDGKVKAEGGSRGRGSVRGGKSSRGRGKVKAGVANNNRARIGVEGSGGQCPHCGAHFSPDVAPCSICNAQLCAPCMHCCGSCNGAFCKRCFLERKECSQCSVRLCEECFSVAAKCDACSEICLCAECEDSKDECVGWTKGWGDCTHRICPACYDAGRFFRICQNQNCVAKKDGERFASCEDCEEWTGNFCPPCMESLSKLQAR